jgi:hypothetical protein
MKFKLFMLIIIGFSLLSYIYGSYIGELIPAWQAACWTFYCFTNELNEYVRARWDSLKLD